MCASPGRIDRRSGCHAPAPQPSAGSVMSILNTNPIVFFWRWLRYRITKWQMKNVDPMYPDIIKYVKDRNDFESTYGSGW